jgi:hypothetical protein
MPTSTARSTRSSSLVDRELGEGAALWVAPEPSDDVEQVGGGSLGTHLTCVALSQRSNVNLADDAAVASLAARGWITVVR